jgi:hypothetical protein
VETIAEEVAAAVLGLDLDDLNTRAGRTRWGYVEPTEAACELLGEALDPFLEEMKRQIDLGFEPAAVGRCQGIVLGLYRCRGAYLPELWRGIRRREDHVTSVGFGRAR